LANSWFVANPEVTQFWSYFLVAGDSTGTQKFADGTQISEGYLRGNFLHGGVNSATAVDQIKHWR
jgi:hypothetical protein